MEVLIFYLNVLWPILIFSPMKRGNSATFWPPLALDSSNKPVLKTLRFSSNFDELIYGNKWVLLGVIFLVLEKVTYKKGSYSP